jgi:zinc transport system permease protein
VSGFWEAVVEYPFLRNALLAGLLASAACGVVGSFVVTRRITAIAGSLAHVALGGIGAAYYLRTARGWEWLDPLHGAVAAALLGAVIIGAVRARGNEREDTVISAMWAVGMAVGVLFLFHTPGYKADLMSYLFGNIVLTSPDTLRLLVVLDVVILVTAGLFYNQLLAVCFDEEFAALRGVDVAVTYTFLLVLTALTIVTLIYVVGVVMVIALLTLPVSVAGLFAKRLWQMMVLATLLSALLTITGLWTGYRFDLPVGATTILLAALVYGVAHVVVRWRRGNA